jgi:2,3-dihydroxybiphenyl 1,2-dioxygenase
MSVSSLGYIGLGVTDPEAWADFACNQLGLMRGVSDGGVIKLRLDSRDWRVALHEGSEDDIVYAGFEVASIPELADLEKRLAEAGFPVKRGDAELLAARGVTDLVVTEDPGGMPVELFCGLKDRADLPFASSVGCSGFLTGEQGLGHVVLAAAEIDDFRTFYLDTLGFRLSDKIMMGPLALEFLHCNPRHHTLALLPAPLPKRIHHIMFEVESLDDVGFALDRCEAAGVPISMGLGKHTNDQMISFYVKSPAGFDIEYGWGGIPVDDGIWRIGHFDKISVWGHKRA